VPRLGFQLCIFYVRQRCVLGAMNHFADKELPEETQLLWYKELAAMPIRDGEPVVLW
jgi:hypothetical protein